MSTEAEVAKLRVQLDGALGEISQLKSQFAAHSDSVAKQIAELKAAVAAGGAQPKGDAKAPAQQANARPASAKPANAKPRPASAPQSRGGSADPSPKVEPAKPSASDPAVGKKSVDAKARPKSAVAPNNKPADKPADKPAALKVDGVGAAAPKERPTSAKPAQGKKDVVSPKVAAAAPGKANPSAGAKPAGAKDAPSGSGGHASHPGGDEGASSYFIQSRKVTVYSPTDAIGKPLVTDAPAKKPVIERVHGYRGRDAFNNLHYLHDGRIVYHAAALCIAAEADVEGYGQQTVFQGHTDDITCLAVHPERKVFASGQVCPKGKANRPYIHVWDADTGKVLASLSGRDFHDSGVRCLAFSQLGRLLASVGSDAEHTVTVWDWAEGKLLHQFKGGKEQIHAAAYNPVTNALVTCGKDNLSVWQFDSADGKPQRSKYVFGPVGEAQPLLCIGFTEHGSILTGTAKTGEVYEWIANTVSAVVCGGHDSKAVLSLRTLPGNGLVTAGKDGKICLWREKEGEASAKPRELVRFADVGVDGRGLDVRVRADRAEVEVVVGGTNGAIKHAILSMRPDAAGAERTHVDVRSVTQSHQGEIWGLATLPSGERFATAAYDGEVALWDAQKGTCLVRVSVGDKPRTLAFSKDGALLAVGNEDGRVTVLNGSDLSKLAEKHDRKAIVSAVKFSPDGHTLAVAGHDHHIITYTVGQLPSGAVELTRQHTLTGHSSYVTHFDFSEDGKHLQSASGDYELLFWDAAAGTQVKNASSLRDFKWDTFNSVLGWPVSGIWPPDSDGTDVNSVDRSSDGSLVATGNDDGTVRLFRCPAHTPGKNKMAPAAEGLGHSAHVACVRFLPNNAGLVSAGGNDGTIIVWRLVPRA